jgi:hypothetical protein
MAVNLVAIHAVAAPSQLRLLQPENERRGLWPSSCAVPSPESGVLRDPHCASTAPRPCRSQASF